MSNVPRVWAIQVLLPLNQDPSQVNTWFRWRNYTTMNPDKAWSTQSEDEAYNVAVELMRAYGCETQVCRWPGKLTGWMAEESIH